MVLSRIQEGGCTRPEPPRVESRSPELEDLSDPHLWADFTAASAVTCLVVGAALLAIGIEVWAIVSWLFGLALGVVAAVLRVTVLPRVIGALAAVASGISAAALVGRILGGH